MKEAKILREQDVKECFYVVGLPAEVMRQETEDVQLIKKTAASVVDNQIKK